MRAFLHASETLLPLLKNFPTTTTLYRRTFWTIRVKTTLMSWAMFSSVHYDVVHHTVVGDDQGRHYIISRINIPCFSSRHSPYFSSFSLWDLLIHSVDLTFTSTTTSLDWPPASRWSRIQSVFNFERETLLLLFHSWEHQCSVRMAMGA